MLSLVDGVVVLLKTINILCMREKDIDEGKRIYKT